MKVRLKGLNPESIDLLILAETEVEEDILNQLELMDMKFGVDYPEKNGMTSLALVARKKSIQSCTTQKSARNITANSAANFAKESE